MTDRRFDPDAPRYKVVRNGEDYYSYYGPGTAEFMAEQLWNRRGGHVQALRPNGDIITEFEE